MPTYESLLLEYKPRPIRNETAYSRALRQVERLMKQRRTRAEDELLELLSSLIVQYESRVYPEPEVSPAEILAHLIEARGTTQAAVCRDTGLARSALTAILCGNRPASKIQAAILGSYFHVSPALLLPNAEPT